MASRWIVHRHGEATLVFSELVGLARSGQLTEEDLVKADWEPDWRPAHTVVGLFYRVRRPDQQLGGDSFTLERAVPARPAHTEAAFSFDDLAADLTLEAVDESVTAPTADPRWMQRYREVHDQRAAEAALSPLKAATESASMQLLADAAVAAMERKSAFGDRVSRWRNRWKRGRELAGSPMVFRLFCAFFVAVLVSASVASWSRQAALRFPKPGRPDRYVVPGWGDCNPREFRVLLVELTLASAMLGYFAAKKVEVWADTKTC